MTERQAVAAIRKELESVADPGRAKAQAKFFKTGPGQYGHGDRFMGIPVPALRLIARRHAKYTHQDDIRQLVASPFHEERFVGLLLLIEMASHGFANRESAAKLYLSIRRGVNSWDLVDVSAPSVLGAYLLDKKDRSVLYELARSEVVWDRRIAMVSTFCFIRNGEFADSLKLSKMLLSDRHELTHKAVGWMLREIGKRDTALLEKFIRDNYSEMPRTTLRYSIERFSKEKRYSLLRLNENGAPLKM